MNERIEQLEQDLASVRGSASTVEYGQ